MNPSPSIHVEDVKSINIHDSISRKIWWPQPVVLGLTPPWREVVLFLEL